MTIDSISNNNTLLSFCYLCPFSNGIAKISLFFWNKFFKLKSQKKREVTVWIALCYSFFRRESASAIYFLYITWNWICYYLYISLGIPWKCFGNQTSTCYCKCKSDSSFLVNERAFSVHDSCDPVLMLCFSQQSGNTVLNKTANRKLFLN